MAKNLKSIYSLGGLLIKKKSLHVIQAINILRVFSSLRFFKVDYYPFDYGKFVKFYNELVVFAMYHNYLKFFKGVYSYLLTILKNNVFFKKNLNSEMKFILKWYKKSIFKYIRRKYLNKYKTLLYHKFKFIRLRKIYYLQKVKFGNKVKKSKGQLLKENKKMEFFSNLVNKKKNLLVIHHYLSYRFKKSLKKKFLYLRKQKQNTKDFIRHKFSDEIVYKKIKKKKKK